MKTESYGSATIVPVEVSASGDLRLPTPVRRALHLRGKKTLVGFVIDGRRVQLAKATVVPEPCLADEELAALAKLSKRAVGKRTLRTTAQALRYLWSL